MKKYGIIFVHGIVGNNRIFDFLRPFVPDTYEVRDIILSGHGGNALDFSRTSMKKWKSQVAECITELSEVCDMVVGVGHSMGCLLLIGQAAESRLFALFLMNPPLRVRPTFRLLANAVKVAADVRGNPVVEAARDAYGVSLDFNPLHYYGWPARYAELFGEIRRVRTCTLNKVKCPVCAVLSCGDEMVMLSSADYLRTLPNAEIFELPDSTHYYYSQDDRRQIITLFGLFFEKVPSLRVCISPLEAP